jgi:hypothetical protein
MEGRIWHELLGGPAFTVRSSQFLLFLAQESRKYIRAEGSEYSRM